ncbi:MAG: ABC transporter permease subunit [Chitinispirillales bacterium]|jgi:polar amino acid transport system substrate-binding protein|nr:ABC transporter permease subunit [Chitinispirillales bacterium]
MESISKMMLRRLLIAIPLIIVLFAACSSDLENIPPDNEHTYADHTDFAGKRIGVITGMITDYATEKYIRGIPIYHTERAAGIEDLKKGGVDGFMMSLPTARILTAGRPDAEKLQIIEVPANIFNAPMGIISVNPDIIERFNVFLGIVRADGTLKDMQERWLFDRISYSYALMPDIPLTGENGVLKVATDATHIPFAYIGGSNKLKGYCIELTLRFAAHEGLEVKFTSMDFSGLIPYTISQKADFAIANISITEERKRSVLFTESIFDEPFGIIVYNPTGDGSAAQVKAKTAYPGLNWIKTGVERNLIAENRWKMILDGLGVTMFISIAAQIIGTLWGCFICFMLLRKNKFVRCLAGLYCGLIHGIPVVVLLMITYYIIFAGVNISSIFVAIAAFTMITGATVSQCFKNAIVSVNPVEIDTARSMGFSSFGAFMTVTLPQAVQRALPAYTSGFVKLVKATSIVGFIAIQDLTRVGSIIRSRTFDAYFPLLFVALVYIIVTAVCVRLFKLIVFKNNLKK